MLEKIVIIVLLVWSIIATMWDGMILGKIPAYAGRWGCPKWVLKILFECYICATPYYGSIAYWLIWHNNWKEWAITIISAMGLQAIIVSFLPKD